MRKVILILSGIFSIFCFLFINTSVRDNYFEKESMNTYLGDTLQFLVFEANDTEDSASSLTIVELASRYHVTVFKNTGSSNNNIQQFIIMNDDVSLSRYGVDSSFNSAEKSVISTNKENGNIGNIQKYDNSFDITKMPFVNENNTRVDGWYSVYGENSGLFYEAFSSTFTNKTQIIDDSDHIIEGYQENSISSSILNFALLFASSSLIILLSYFTSRAKEISIKRMHGYSLYKLLISEIKYMIVGMIVADIIILLLMSIVFIPSLNKLHIPMLTSVIAALCLKYLLMFLVCGIVILYLKTRSISSLLKNRNVSRYVSFINISLRVLFIFLMSTSISKALPEFIDSYRYISQYNSFVEISKDYMHNTSVVGFLSPESNATLDKVAIEYQKNNRFLGISSSNYQNSLQTKLTWLDVNSSYLKEFPVYSSTGSPVQIKDDSKQYLLVPKSISDNPEKYSVTVGKMSEFIDFEEIEIEDNQYLFTFDMTINDRGLGYANDVPILVSGEIPWQNLYFKDSDNLLRNEIENEISRNNIRTKMNYDYVEDEASKLLKSKISVISYEATFILLYSIQLLVLIAQYIIMMINNKKSEYLIKKLNGYSFLNRYSDIVFVLLSTYLLNFICVRLLDYSTITSIVLLLTMVIDMIFTSSLIYILESKSIGDVLKGE